MNRPGGILFDIDGVFYVGDKAVSGGAETVAWAEREQIPFVFVTNTTSQPRSYLADKLASLGIAVDADRIHTPSVAARAWLTDHHATPIALFVPDETAAEFDGLDRLPRDESAGAGAVVVGDLGEAWDFATLNRAFRLLMAEPRPALVSLGMTRYWHDAAGLTLDVGPFTQALAFATGAEPVVTGKPAREFFEAATQRLKVAASDVVMVGDDIRGDIEGAQQAGIKAVLVRTGKFQPSDLDQGVTPDAVLDSVADLPT